MSITALCYFCNETSVADEEESLYKFLSWLVICKTKFIHVYRTWFVLWLSFNKSTKKDWFTTYTFKIYFSVLASVIYLAIFSSKPSYQNNILNEFALDQLVYTYNNFISKIICTELT